MTTLRGRLWLGFAGLLLILIVVSALSVAVLTRYSHVLEKVFRENYDSAVYCDAMKDSLDRLDVAAQRRAWGAPQISAVEITADTLRFNDNLRRQLDNCTLPGERQLSDRLAADWARYQVAFHRLDGVNSTERAEVYRQSLLPEFQEMKRTAQRVADMNMSNMVSVDGQARRALTEVRNALLVLVSLGTLAAAVLVGAMVATIVRPLRLLSHGAREIGRGNLDLKMVVGGADEVGQLAEAFNSMATQLRHLRQLNHEKLDRIRQTTQLAIDSLPDAVLLLGPDGDVEISNRTAREHFGILPGKKVDELNLDWLTRLYTTVRHDACPLDPDGYRSAIQIFDGGRERFMLPRAVPVLAADGATIGITVVLVDVTRLRHADELKSGLLSTVSHELRTPLTSIRMALGLLSDDRIGTISAPQKKLLTAAREDSDRLYRIIENLLQVSRIEAGRSGVNRQAIPASQIIIQAVEPLKQAFLDQQLHLVVEMPPDGLRVLADPNSIGFALSNLLTNALKFTPAGGQVQLSACVEDSSVRFTVGDTGPGIPPEFVPRLFEKFFRLPRDAGRAGAGLGLSIAREIVDANLGKVAFSLRPGGGSRFSFTLPLAEHP